ELPPFPTRRSSDLVDKFLIELETQLQDKEVVLSATAEAREWLARNGFDPQMGARPMARVIQEKIKRPLADEVLFGKLMDGGRVTVDVRDDELVIETEGTTREPEAATVE